MRFKLLATLFLRHFLYLVCTSPWAHADSVIVSGTANIFGAGHSTPPSGIFGIGTLPSASSFVGGAGQVLTFPSVTGSVTAGDASFTGADGYSIFNTGDIPASTDISSVDGISGITSANRGFFLVGVFLNNGEPSSPAPARLDFTAPNDFLSIGPQLNQTFFIGDGRTSTDAIQRFLVPSNATRLFLGFADSADPARNFLGFHGPPGFYADNGGSLTVNFTGLNAVPEPGTVAFLALGAIGVLAARWVAGHKKPVKRYGFWGIELNPMHTSRLDIRRVDTIQAMIALGVAQQRTTQLCIGPITEDHHDFDNLPKLWIGSQVVLRHALGRASSPI